MTNRLSEQLAREPYSDGLDTESQEGAPQHPTPQGAIKSEPGVRGPL
ncbi:MAG: hypothetical protein M3Q29_16910 [Chloroflexota bacterium]|nr:hypothetical protein [Chloroflexota bacterium]